MASTVRFSRIVEACGQPRVHTLWVEPEQDSELQRARASHRVMTVQRTQGKTDFGTVGFERSPAHTGEYLIFPKSLRRFEGKRVVGVKFDLIEQPNLAGIDSHLWTRPTRRAVRKGKAAPPAEPIPFPPPPEKKEPGSALAAPPVATSPVTTAKRATARVPAPRRAPAGVAAAKRAPAQSRVARTPAPRKNRVGAASTRESTLRGEHQRLVRAVRAALKELKQGKAVAAYQRLEHAVK